ncbi:MAG: Hsp20/alpha crystallin family protein [Patescibacteria group bacterium]|nr:Hsp20/alpha crystallin family protein [Patescibacteria group bacterium]
MVQLKKWGSFRDWLDKFFEEEDFFPFPFSFSGNLATDVYETDKELIVEMQVPGFKKENIKISIQDGYLKVEGKYDEVDEEREKNYWRKEIRRSSFARAIPLPRDIETKGAKANFENGVLRIKLPKLEPSEKAGEEIKIE